MMSCYSAVLSTNTVPTPFSDLCMYWIMYSGLLRVRGLAGSYPASFSLMVRTLLSTVVDLAEVFVFVQVIPLLLGCLGCFIRSLFVAALVIRFV